MGKFSVVNKWLRYVNRHDLVLSVSEQHFLPILEEYFNIFAIVTKAIEGNLYSTINLAVIFAEELKDQLSTKLETLSLVDIDDVYKEDLRILYEASLENLDKRMNITDEMVCSTMLDPTFQHSNYIKDFLLKRNVSKSGFIKLMFQKYVGDYNDKIETDTTIETTKKSFVQNLAKKYSRNVQNNGIDKEIKKFDNINEFCYDDLINWWSSIGKQQFPILARLARIMLQITATSANVERLNSAAGTTMTKQRCNLHHSKFEKIMVIFYNYPHLDVKLT